MRKFADRYFQVDPWKVVEQGFDPAYAQTAESIFSLGNEYMGLRGYFEEGYSGESLQGSYINGIYERRMLGRSGYKGMLPFTEFMVNTVDWLYLRISCNGQALDLAHSRYRSFVRSLDLRTGVLTRSFIWEPDENTSLKMEFERFLSMERPGIGGQRLNIRVLRGRADVRMQAGLDFSRLHVSAQANYWNCTGARSDSDGCRIYGTTHNTRQTVFAQVRFTGMEGIPIKDCGEKQAATVFTASIGQEESLTLTRLVSLLHCKDETCMDAFKLSCAAVSRELEGFDYDLLKAESTQWWARQWEVSDIEIQGDEENQQGIRYCIFQMHQTLHTADHSAVIGAKGLTGEVYNGNSFWDTEVYCLPFYLFNNPRAAKSILQFRYDTLPKARERAKALDSKGAFYPIATISGRECCDLWQHANLQLQASTGVMYGLWNYVRITGDRELLYTQGAEILVEVCRMLATRGDFNPKTGAYGFWGVMGPDEFQIMVNNNCYTNYMGRKTFLYTLEVLDEMRKAAPQQYDALVKKLDLTSDEPEDWAHKAQSMYIPYDEKSMLFEQNDGFFNLPHLDIGTIPVEDFPLYSHWSYDRIYRNDMIKQPDVLMFMLMYVSSFPNDQITANFDYYEPRCIHESSLSPSVHSILAAQIGRMEQAYALFRFSTRMDLDNYNRNTREGLHTTSIAASWMNIVYGFGGLRSDGDKLELNPSIPDVWQSYCFRLQYQGRLISVTVVSGYVTLKVESGEALEILVFGRPVKLSSQPMRIAFVKAEEIVV